MCLITPTKWLAGNKTFKKVRYTLLSERHLKEMRDYMNAGQVFAGRSIAGGVSYFLYDKEYIGDTKFTTINNQLYTNNRELKPNDIVPRHYIGDLVIEKVKQKSEAFLCDYIYKDLWNLRTDYEGSVIRSNDKEVEIITPRGTRYEEYGIEPEYYNTYKVSFTRAVAGKAVEPDKDYQYRLLSTIRVLKPGQICNASYMVIPNITTKEYAENIKAYLETKFVRFLVLQTLFGIGLTPSRFKYVPFVDFTKQWTDEELYERYEISDKEREFIEALIKPINTKKSTPSAPKFTSQDAAAAYVYSQLHS